MKHVKEVGVISDGTILRQKKTYVAFFLELSTDALQHRVFSLWNILKLWCFFGTWWFGQLLVGAFHLESSEKDPKNPWKNEGFLRPKNMGYN